MDRICIYPKDVQIITGKSERWGRDIIKKIKVKFSKESRTFFSQALKRIASLFDVFLKLNFVINRNIRAVPNH